MTAIVIVYLDLVTKVGFGVIVLNASGVFGAADAGATGANDGPAPEATD